MNILPELGRIAAARYGLQLKDPVLTAFDKLEQDEKFELVHDEYDNDYADMDAVMKRYFSDVKTSYILRDFLELLYHINGRKGFYAKVENPTPQQNICYWIDMLIKELINSANGDATYSLPSIGNGIVNGTKFRAAMYYILDILQNPNAIPSDDVTFKSMDPLYFYGRDLSYITVYGNADGVGEIVSEDPVNIRINLKVTNLLDPAMGSQTITATFGRGKLYEGDSVSIEIPNNVRFPYSIYKLQVDDYITEVEATFKLTKQGMYDASDEDFTYMTDMVDPQGQRSLRYISDYNRLRTPTSLGGDPFLTIGYETFMDKSVGVVVIQAPVTTIE